MPKIILKSSKIHGKGVFANQAIKKGETIIKWKAKLLSRSQALKTPTKLKQYLDKVNDLYYLMGIPERYVNHSCSPNAKEQGFRDVAIKNIRKGEEITIKYTKFDLSKEFDCNCKHKNC